MNRQQLLFEYSPVFILLCIGLGLGYAWILYRAKHTWSKFINQFLFVLRALLVSVLAFLLIGPIVKLTHNITEKPTIAFLLDNSLSIREALDSLKLQKFVQETERFRNSLADQGYEVTMRNLSGEGPNAGFKSSTSDISGALRNIIADYEGKNLAGIVLATDGIYNSGTSPLYSTFRMPVYTVGLGDTTQHVDLVLKNLAFNKIAYQGNQFPLRVEVVVQGLQQQDIAVSVDMGSRRPGEPSKHLWQKKNSGSNSLLDFDFKLDATEKGLQRIDVVVEPIRQESNVKNNRASAFVEVIEGKKKILVIAPAPHPDIKTLRSVVEKNSNYEFILHMPGVKEADAAILQPGKADLVIFHQVADLQGKTASLFARMSKGPSSMLLVIGAGSNVRQVPAMGIPLTFENAGQWDETTPVVNPNFSGFAISENSNGIISGYPPVTVPFGKFSYPANAGILLHQRIGSVNTDRPLLLTYDDNNRKIGMLIGDGIWRWRLNEFSVNGKTEVFDEVFSKLIQYLSTLEDKRKFRCFPVQNEFTDSEPVVFESQVYNDLYEQVYGKKIDIELRDDRNRTQYSYVTGPGSTRYRIGGLKEGVYRYKAVTNVEGRPEEVHGEFLVIAQNLEAQNLTADFVMLRKLADHTGGKFYNAADLNMLESDLKSTPAKSLIHSEEVFSPLMDLKLIFFFLLTLVAGEWFIRKYLGSY